MQNILRSQTCAVIAALLWTWPLAAQQPRDVSGATVASFYDLKTRTLAGKPADLSQYRGTVSLVVNVASFCGYTPQYKGLEQLHRDMKGKEFNVLGFPSNDFGEQEPGTAQEIADFCRLTYDVTFPMFEKVVTRSGPSQSPVYAFLGRSGHLPAWNFNKYVIDRMGHVVAFFPSDVTPEDPKLRAAIAKALAAR
jgi:glutathione peroxidase